LKEKNNIVKDLYSK